MKNMKTGAMFITLIYFMSLASKAQEANWRSLTAEHRHFASLHLGVDYSTYSGVAYGYKISKILPLIAGAEMTIPFGKDILDDWKLKINGQTEVWHNSRFSFSVKPGIILRKYKSEVARLYNIGADINANFGYYKPRWGIALEGNYDRSFSTHIQHDLLKDYYPGIKDGWYGSSGGNFKFGASMNYAVKTWSAFLKLGKIYGQNFDDNPTLPFFFDLSLQKRF